ncbi:PREDICTED: uncharacterized protein LOC108610156 [Drosophila arizonae]|uniref:Uncharacterized protein LOC108610156 n=1 Tax=Drosophila arizonae TaxID=7263 RepID=A0ABM1NRH4_DROAR|nr:PREDICTED: uncharacterized protein LOC108610156 [Drosophila arizonae]
MDEFGCFDPKLPASDKSPDWRTSTYRGHRHITDTRLGSKLNAPRECSNKGIFVRDPLLHEKQLTEISSNYVWKYPDPNVLRNPSLNMKTQYMKRFEEGNLRFIKRKTKPLISVSQEAFTFVDLPFEADQIPIRMPTPVETTKVLIDRSKIGYTKYLDPSATTYNLSYVHYTPQDIKASIAAPDTITFWNWAERGGETTTHVTRVADEVMCDETNALACPKRRLEYPSQLKCVPHTGLITEVRANYLNPRLSKEYIDYDTTDVQPVLVSEPFAPFAKSSEYGIYGSGDPVRKYV